MIGKRGYQIVSLSMIFSNELSGAFKDNERIQILGG